MRYGTSVGCLGLRLRQAGTVTRVTPTSSMIAITATGTWSRDATTIATTSTTTGVQYFRSMAHPPLHGLRLSDQLWIEAYAAAREVPSTWSPELIVPPLAPWGDG